MNQTEFAALAGASKRAMVSWEKGESAPVATALLAWAEAGADAGYILLGTRPNERRSEALYDIKDELMLVRRALFDPENSDEEVARRRAFYRNSIEAKIRYDANIMTPDLRREADELLSLINDDTKLREARRAKHGAQRTLRDRNRREIASWFEGTPSPPTETSIYMLASIATEFGVPVRTLVDVAEELRHEAMRADRPDPYEHAR